MIDIGLVCTRVKMVHISLVGTRLRNVRPWFGFLEGKNVKYMNGMHKSKRSDIGLVEREYKMTNWFGLHERQRGRHRFALHKGQKQT